MDQEQVARAIDRAVDRARRQWEEEASEARFEFLRRLREDTYADMDRVRDEIRILRRHYLKTQQSNLNGEISEDEDGEDVKYGFSPQQAAVEPYAPQTPDVLTERRPTRNPAPISRWGINDFPVERH